MLVVLSGLPGTGKTTIGKALAAKRSAAYVRVDEIEHALRRSGRTDQDIGPAGYIVAFAIASSNLKLGNLVVADSVNPVADSRRGWRTVALDAGMKILEVEVVCSDEDEHRRRVETRTPDIEGLTLPSWSSVKGRDYVPWGEPASTEPRLVIDTAVLRPAEAVAAVEVRIDVMSR